MGRDFAERLNQGRSGRLDALEELFSRWRPLLSLQARQALGSDLSARVDSSDIVQEALTQAFRDLAQFRGATEGEWVAWLRSIVAAQAAKVRRHHHARRRDAALEGGPSPSQAVAPERGSDRKLIDEEQAVRLASAIERLPEPMREVIVRRVFGREPFDSLARSLGKTPGATRVLWTRALARLRQDLDGEEADLG